MREIIYRGKAINRDKGYHRTRYKNGDWVYGLVTRLYDERFENVPAEMKDLNGVSGIEVDYKTLQQYTEMSDNNHDGIFEGDIVRCKQEKNEGICVVQWFNGAFLACPISGNLLEMTLHDYWLNDYDLVEIIGNEIDNPELLIGEK